MNKKNKSRFFPVKLGMLLIATLLLSCETEYNDKVNTLPGDVIQVPGYTQIESFKITDTEDNPISAAITGENIVITWSNHMALPETVTPQIILGEGAAISPASGVAVPFQNGTLYTVTSQAGTTRQYSLKIDFRQPEPQSWTANGGEMLYKGLIQKMTNYGTSGSIDNLWMSLPDTRVYFVAATDQTEYTAEIIYLGTGEGVAPFNEYGVYYFLPENMPLGMYDLRIKNGDYVLQNNSVENRFKIEILEPDYFKTEKYGFPTTKQAGQTLEVRGGLLTMLTAVEIFNSDNPDVIYPLEIVNVTSYRATLKLPSNIPSGTYNKMRFTRGEEVSNLTYPVMIE